MDLPESVLKTMRTTSIAEFATVTKDNLPIDTPLLCFGRDNGMVEVTTGVAYPAKANRARRNPKVGLLFEPAEDPFGAKAGPTVLVEALASVRDADIAANSERYAREPLARLASGVTDWATARHAIWYYARIWIQCFPMRVWWWEGAANPLVWSAPEETVTPASDSLARAGKKPSTAWPVAEVVRRKAAALDSGTLPHLTLVNGRGWPLPARCTGLDETRDGFSLELPPWVPWQVEGAACLSFAPAMATFVGRIEGSSGKPNFQIDRLLPDLPMVQDPSEVIQPRSETKAKLLLQLDEQLALRGQPRPVLPEQL